MIKVLLNNVSIDIDVVINLMDDEIREYLHNLQTYDDEQSFLDAYVQTHKSKFSENFTI
jgi:tRNA nucleotidyltransferase/poly(A) polymerase